MKKLLSVALVCAFTNFAFAKTEISISYSLNWFEPLHKELIGQFEKANPGVKVNLRVATNTYNEGSAKLMREKIINQLPDIAFVSFSNLAPLKAKNIPSDITQYFSKEDEKEGFTKTMLNPAIIDGKIYGVPFVASLPITYYNMDLVKQAKWNKELPKTWEELFELSQKINKIDGKQGMFFDNGSDNWLYIALLMSQKGSLAKDGRAGFDNEIGLWANKKLYEMSSVAKMPPFSISDATKSFYAGNLGVLIASSAGLSTKEKGIDGKFQLKTSIFPSVQEGGKLPVGGSVALVTSSDKKKKEMAIKYIKFICGKVGNMTIVKHTGYMPTNKLAQKNLSAFYANNPNQLAAPKQVNFMGPWPSFPGDNSIKATSVLKDHVETLLLGQRHDYQEVLKEMTDDINQLLP